MFHKIVDILWLMKIQSLLGFRLYTHFHHKANMEVNKIRYNHQALYKFLFVQYLVPQNNRTFHYYKNMTSIDQYTHLELQIALLVQ